MRIHHLNCGSHCPFGGALFDGSSRGLLADICTHCLLIETGDSLVLVDTGYGLKDVRRTAGRRLPLTWPLLLNTRLRESDTAIRQVEALGYSPRDVRHIVLTHLDFDHAGGIEDFPEARIHVMASELEATRASRRGFVARQRYRPAMWDEVRDWRSYAGGGEAWFGFEAVRALDGLPADIVMVPLRGHTLGHAGVAIRSGDGWLLDAGDSFMHHGELDAVRPFCPLGLRAYQAIMSSDRGARLANQERLRALQRDHAESVTIFASHDSGQLAALRAMA
jgi:glyoxylase-like metal-dependent hydrolase (beta-lactamase superfamily II)